MGFNNTLSAQQGYIVPLKNYSLVKTLISGQYLKILSSD